MSGGHQSRERAYTEDDVKAMTMKAFGMSIAMGTDVNQCRNKVIAILDALTAAGRLLPASAERRQEWTMRYKINGTEQLGEDGGHVLDSREDCEMHIKAWRTRYPSLSYTDVRYLYREVITGPWVPVDEDRPVGEVKDGIEEEERA